MGEIEARLQQSEKEKMAHSQEADQLQEKLQEAKAKWVELHDVVLAAAERESAFEDQINNLKADLHSKTKEANPFEEKRVKMEEKFKRNMEKKWIHLNTTIELDSRLNTMRSERDDLQVETDRLQAKLQD
ncbi:uncharacterized protein [Nicotiana tomentosiformis]|uniref:uncharacterized protein n=1 Tax=Nicotiana tomentosiformis TaxID=4098 RepID=UPI00388CECA1